MGSSTLTNTASSPCAVRFSTGARLQKAAPLALARGRIRMELGLNSSSTIGPQRLLNWYGPSFRKARVPAKSKYR